MTRKPHPNWTETETVATQRLFIGPALPLSVWPYRGRWHWCHENTKERGDAAAFDAAKLAAEDSMLAHAKLVIATLEPCQAATPAPKCLSQSPGDPNDEADPPVTCTREKGHRGKHAGGTRCGALEWER
jgi:hypothetical protein